MFLAVGKWRHCNALQRKNIIKSLMVGWNPTEFVSSGKSLNTKLTANSISAHRFSIITFYSFLVVTAFYLVINAHDCLLLLITTWSTFSMNMKHYCVPLQWKMSLVQKDPDQLIDRLVSFVLYVCYILPWTCCQYSRPLSYQIWALLQQWMTQVKSLWL